MAIGRTFQESLQKAIRGLETGRDGLNEIVNSEEEIEFLNQKVSTPSPDRLWYVADAFREYFYLFNIQLKYLVLL